MLPESTHVNVDHIRALIGADILHKYPSAPITWLKVSTEFNMRRLACMHLGKCAGMGINLKKKPCCSKKQRCFRPCK